MKLFFFDLPKVMNHVLENVDSIDAPYIIGNTRTHARRNNLKMSNARYVEG